MDVKRFGSVDDELGVRGGGALNVHRPPLQVARKKPADAKLVTVESARLENKATPLIRKEIYERVLILTILRLVTRGRVEKGHHLPTRRRRRHDPRGLSRKRPRGGGEEHSARARFSEHGGRGDVAKGAAHWRKYGGAVGGHREPRAQGEEAQEEDDAGP